ncbi:MAG TPA: VTT domain-containing protein [Burkholderiales bacterium]
MEAFFSAEASLASLLIATFLASTLIPLSSELVLLGVLKLHPDIAWLALVVATTGNTLGGMTSYLIGRYFGSKKPLKHVERLRRWGAPALFFAWLPFVGDALCIAAGWLKLDWRATTAYQAAGRFARYSAIAFAFGLTG